MKKSAKSNNTDYRKVCSVLSYLVVGVIWYFIDKDMKRSSTVKFHVKQGLTLIIFAIIWSILLNIIFVASFYTTWGLVYILKLVPWVFVIIGIINAAKNNQKELPLIGRFAKKFTF